MPRLPCPFQPSFCQRRQSKETFFLSASLSLALSYSRRFASASSPSLFPLLLRFLKFSFSFPSSSSSSFLFPFSRRDLLLLVFCLKMNTAAVWGGEEGEEVVATAELQAMSASDLRIRTSMIDSEVRVLKSEVNRLRFELHSMQVRQPRYTRLAALSFPSCLSLSLFETSSWRPLFFFFYLLPGF